MSERITNSLIKKLLTFVEEYRKKITNYTVIRNTLQLYIFHTKRSIRHTKNQLLNFGIGNEIVIECFHIKLSRQCILLNKYKIKDSSICYKIDKLNLKIHSCIEKVIEIKRLEKEKIEADTVIVANFLNQQAQTRYTYEQN